MTYSQTSFNLQEVSGIPDLPSQQECEEMWENIEPEMDSLEADTARLSSLKGATESRYLMLFQQLLHTRF